MDKQPKNVYPGQTQSVNYMMNHMPMAPPHQQHPASAPSFYQNPMAAGPMPQMQAMYFAAPSVPATYPQPMPAQTQQAFMMGPPPAYSNTSAPTYPTGYCPPPAYQPPMFHNVAAAAPPAGYSMAGPQTAVFDAGARFNGKGPVNIPPPPPGYMPNAAQVAAMQGQSVVVEKKKNNFFTGGKGAGYSFW